MESFEKFWINWCPEQGRAPRKKHYSFEEAQAESFRLTKLEKLPVFVLECVGKSVLANQPVIWVATDSPPPKDDTDSEQCIPTPVPLGGIIEGLREPQTELAKRFGHEYIKDKKSAVDLCAQLNSQLSHLFVNPLQGEGFFVWVENGSPYSACHSYTTTILVSRVAHPSMSSSRVEICGLEASNGCCVLQDLFTWSVTGLDGPDLDLLKKILNTKLSGVRPSDLIEQAQNPNKEACPKENTEIANKLSAATLEGKDLQPANSRVFFGMRTNTGIE